MAWKPWYEQLAEMNNKAEKEEFMKGIFGGSRLDRAPKAALLIAGYIGLKGLIKKKK